MTAIVAVEEDSMAIKELSTEELNVLMSELQGISKHGIQSISKEDLLKFYHIKRKVRNDPYGMKLYVACRVAGII